MPPPRGGWAIVPALLGGAVLAAAGLLAAAGDAPKGPPAGPVSVLDFGAKGDGATDDAPAIQKALDANPGRTILLPDTRPGVDYALSASLSMKGDGQRLVGEGEHRTTLKFAAKVPGILTGDNHWASIADLTLEGSEVWWVVYPEQAVLPEGFGGLPGASSADGIRIKANNVRVENVTIRYFGRHGINIGGDGTEATMGDNFCLTNVYSTGNRGCGLHVQGGDTNAGTTIQFRAYLNQLWGIYDRSFLGNAHISPNASTNHVDGTPGKAATKVWEAAGAAASGGPFKSSGNVGNVWIHPYAEGDQGPCEFGFRDVVIQGDLGSGTKGDHFWVSTARDVVGAKGTPFLYMTTAGDEPGDLVLRPGRTAPQAANIRTLNPDGTPRWVEARGVGEWVLWEGEVGTGKARLRVAKGGPVTIDGVAVGASPPRVRTVKSFTIPRGQTAVAVPHGLGGQPALEDVALIPDGPSPVWVSAVTATAITVRIGAPAPANGRTFTLSASRQP